MGTVKAVGVLRHCFFGEYSGVIGLAFCDTASAIDAYNVLKKHNFNLKTNSKNLIWQGNSDQLEDCLDLLDSFGADRNKVTSIKHSIDYGEQFEVVIPVIPAEQLMLPGM